MAPLWVMLALKWPRAHDFIFYAGILSDFSTQFWEGQWYPRWLMKVYDGYGSPIFVYYNPLIFFLLTPFQWLAPWDPYGLWRTVLGMQIALFAAGITSYRWLRHHFPVAQAQTGALLYAGFPYVTIVVYFNYGLGSLWAIAFMPLVLESIDRIRNHGWRSGVPVLAVAYALMCLSHLVTLFTFIAIPLSYAVVMAAPKDRLRQLFWVGFSGFLAILLSLFHLLPMQLNQPYIVAERFTSGHLNYADHFWMLHSLFGFLCFIPPLVGLYFEQPKFAGKRPVTRVMRYWMITLAAMLFMILPCSKWLWDAVTPLHYLQFPMRFYIPMWPAVVFLAVTWLPQAKTRGIYPFLLTVMLANTAINSWESWFNDATPAADAKTIVGLNNNPESFPRWVDLPLPSGLFENAQQATIVGGEGKVSVTHWSAGDIRLHTEAKGGEGRVVLHQFYYPYWRSNDGTVEPFHGLLSMKVPSGDHDITITGGDMAGERLGAMISLAALCAIALISVYRRREILAG